MLLQLKRDHTRLRIILKLQEALRSLNQSRQLLQIFPSCQTLLPLVVFQMQTLHCDPENQQTILGTKIPHPQQQLLLLQWHVLQRSMANQVSSLLRLLIRPLRSHLGSLDLLVQTRLSCLWTNPLKDNDQG